MSKVRSFSEIAPNIAFPEFNFYELYYSTFENSELGRIKKLLPLREMAENLLIVREKSDMGIIARMYRQRKNHFHNNDSRESIPSRLVSLSKPHLRPIVRGKEVKSVEFGAKVDVILFIEKLSFNAFNEWTRLMHYLKMHKRLLGGEAKNVGGDTGYAGTENRDYCKADRNPLHLLRHSYGKRGAVGGQDRAKSAFSGCLTRKLAVNAELLWENCILVMKNRQKIQSKRLEIDIKLKF